MPGRQGENLKDNILPGGSRLVQYAHDLLLVCMAYEGCLRDTICLYSALAERKGHPTPLQLCHQEIKDLGFILTKEQRSVDPEFVQAVVEIPRNQ